MTHELERILETLAPPQPPPELRHRTLRAAAEVLNTPAVRDPWTRIWESRPLRLAWAVAVVGLIAANVLISAKPQQSPTTPRAFLFPYDGQFNDEELRGIASLQRLDLNPRMLSEVFAAAGAVRTTPHPKTSNAKENV